LVFQFFFTYYCSIESIIHIHIVWASFSMIEIGEWAIVVGVSTIVSPFRLVLDLSICLHIKAVIHVHVIWACLSVVEVGEGAIIVGIS